MQASFVEEVLMSETNPAAPSKKFMSGDDFRIWRTSRDLTLKEVGEWLGISLTAVSYYEKNGASQTVAMALSAIDHGLPPYTVKDEDRRFSEKAKANKGEQNAGRKRH